MGFKGMGENSSFFISTPIQAFRQRSWIKQRNRFSSYANPFKIYNCIPAGKPEFHSNPHYYNRNHHLQRAF